MKLQLLVIGCCVALVVSKPTEDACAAMRARLFPSLTASARANAGGLRSCDADHNGAVDGAEFVSCVQRAFGSTADVGRAEMGKRVHCFKSIMTNAALDGGRDLTIDSEQVRLLGLGSGLLPGGSGGIIKLPELKCGSQNQLGGILTSIAAGQLQAAIDAAINLLMNLNTQVSGLLNSLLKGVSSLLQSLLSGGSLNSLVNTVTSLVRSASNALTAPVEDALISALLQVSVGNITGAQITIQARLDAGVLNPVTQDALQAIIDTFDNGSAQEAVASITSLLAGTVTTLNDTLSTLLLNVYDQLAQQSDTTNDLFSNILMQILQTPQCLSTQIMQGLGEIGFRLQIGNLLGATHSLISFLTSPIGFDSQFSLSLATVVNDVSGSGTPQILSNLIASYGNNSVYAEAIGFVQAASNALTDGNINGVVAEIRKILEMSISNTP